MCFNIFRKKKKEVIVSNHLTHHEEKETVMKSEILVEEIDPIVVVDKKKVKIQKYHVSQNKNKEAEYFMKWRVRKEGSSKTIQYFDTQKLAIDYAQSLADKFGTTVVIHKLDGSIRKQDYSSKV